MKVFGYIDETSFEDESGNQYSGTGMFICKETLKSSLLDKATQKLRKYDFKNERNRKKENKVIESKIFHANEDTYNTRISFIETLNENVKGHFKYSILKEKQNDKTDKIQNDAMELCVLLVSNDFFDISILIEDSNKFTPNLLRQWEENLYLKLERSIYNTPTIPLFFPKISFQLIKKNESNFGLQTIDYLLWIYQRAIGKKKDDTWIKKLNLNMVSNYHSENKEEFGGDYWLNESFLKSELYYPNDIDLSIIKEDIRVTFSRMEEIILKIKLSGLNKRIKHLNKTLDKTWKMIEGKSIANDEYVVQIATTFIRVFDNYPIYKDFDKNLNKWNTALYTRKISSLLIKDRNQIHVSRAIDTIIKFKNNG